MTIFGWPVVSQTKPPASLRFGPTRVCACLVCGADEGNSFAVARVNAKTGTIPIKTSKIASKPAKVLAAFSNDGKSSALIDYNFKHTLFKTEQFKNLE